MTMLRPDGLRDAGLIASAQKLEHAKLRHTAPWPHSPVNWGSTTSRKCCI